MHYWEYGEGAGWVGALFMLISMVLLWAVLITVVVVLLRRFARPAHAHDEALRILNERLARGEIDKDEYEQRRAAIQR
jgi:putative membrane protein